jgi:hypothetical protein
MSIPSTYFPDPALAEYILSYGILEIPEGITEPIVSPPIGLSGFIFQLHDSTGNAVAMVNGNNLLTHKFAVTGQVTSTVTGYQTGKIKILLVFFQPLGMYQLFGNDMSRLTNTSMNLLELSGVEKAQNWLELSGLTGYYDQSHMIRYFKEYLKVSPNQLVTLDIDFINYLLSR